MTKKIEAMRQRKGTRFSADGLTVFVKLQVGRRDYEFARAWAAFHANADPAGTAEDHLEGYLNMTLMDHATRLGWRAPAEIEALYDDCRPLAMDDGIPF